VVSEVSGLGFLFAPLVGRAAVMPKEGVAAGDAVHTGAAVTVTVGEGFLG